MKISATTGHGFEAEFFGLPFTPVSLKQENVPYLNVAQGIEEAIVKQDSLFRLDPFAPSALPAKTLYEAVKKKLEDMGYVDIPLFFYCTVNLALDMWHGVDGFFNFKTAYFGIDLTLNPNKVAAKLKECILVRKEHLEQDKFEELADLIANGLIIQLTKKARIKLRKTNPLHEVVMGGTTIKVEVKRDTESGEVTALKIPLGAEVSAEMFDHIRKKYFLGTPRYDVVFLCQEDGILVRRKNPVSP